MLSEVSRWNNLLLNSVEELVPEVFNSLKILLSMPPLDLYKNIYKHRHFKDGFRREAALHPQKR